MNKIKKNIFVNIDFFYFYMHIFTLHSWYLGNIHRYKIIIIAYLILNYLSFQLFYFDFIRPLIKHFHAYFTLRYFSCV